VAVAVAAAVAAAVAVAVAVAAVAVATPPAAVPAPAAAEAWGLPDRAVVASVARPAETGLPRSAAPAVLAVAVDVR